MMRGGGGGGEAGQEVEIIYGWALISIDNLFQGNGQETATSLQWITSIQAEFPSIRIQNRTKYLYKNKERSRGRSKRKRFESNKI